MPKEESTKSWLARVAPIAEKLHHFRNAKKLQNDIAVDVPTKRLTTQDIMPKAEEGRHRKEQQKPKLLKVKRGQDCPEMLQEEMGEAHRKQTESLIK